MDYLTIDIVNDLIESKTFIVIFKSNDKKYVLTEPVTGSVYVNFTEKYNYFMNEDEFLNNIEVHFNNPIPIKDLIKSIYNNDEHI